MYIYLHTSYALRLAQFWDKKYLFHTKLVQIFIQIGRADDR